mmetsp:Transcript_39034/g.107516  ORF Transcript_39034/g.107516 Transcript_39034/m.107516 type:complete len:227 (-) Transcript_39034:504-1184(-)
MRRFLLRQLAGGLELPDRLLLLGAWDLAIQMACPYPLPVLLRWAHRGIAFGELDVKYQASVLELPAAVVRPYGLEKRALQFEGILALWTRQHDAKEVRLDFDNSVACLGNAHTVSGHEDVHDVLRLSPDVTVFQQAAGASITKAGRNPLDDLLGLRDLPGFLDGVDPALDAFRLRLRLRVTGLQLQYRIEAIHRRAEVLFGETLAVVLEEGLRSSVQRLDVLGVDV